MSPSASYIEFTKDLFAPFGEIKVKKMFGGAGVYCDDLFFALIADEEIYLKADAETFADFHARGLSQFVFEMKDGRQASMSYYGAPEEIYDDRDELEKWTSLALDAARRAAKLKKPKRKKPAARPRAM